MSNPNTSELSYGLMRSGILCAPDNSQEISVLGLLLDIAVKELIEQNLFDAFMDLPQVQSINDEAAYWLKSCEDIEEYCE